MNNGEGKKMNEKHAIFEMAKYKIVVAMRLNVFSYTLESAYIFFF